MTKKLTKGQAEVLAALKAGGRIENREKPYKDGVMFLGLFLVMPDGQERSVNGNVKVRPVWDALRAEGVEVERLYSKVTLGVK